MTPELFQFVRRIQIKTLQLSKGILAGTYRSAFRGKGLEFHETREYSPGDDIRHIEWKQSSRSSRLYVKTFKEERELNIILALDISASERFGTDKLKSQLMAEIGAVLAFAALRNNDKVGLLLFSDHVEKYLPPRQNSRHILRIIRDMLLYQPQGKGTNTSAALRFLAQMPQKSGICFLISDFLTEDFSKEATLIAQKFDLIGIALSDPAEKIIPVMPLATVQDLETEEIALISIPDEATQSHFLEAKTQQMNQTKKLFSKIGADFLEIQTDQPYLPILQKFFNLRSLRK